MKRTALSLTALAAFASAPSAVAAVYYSGLRNLTVPTGFTGVYLDVDGAATSSVEFTGWDINPFFGGYGVANSPSFQPVRTGTTNAAPLLRLNVGDVINATRLFSAGFGGSDAHVGSGGNQFAIGAEGYLGFKLTTNAAAGPFYGWMRVVFTANTGGAIIKDWAYETTAPSIFAARIVESAPLAGVQTVTLSGGAGESTTLGSLVADHDGNATALTKAGAGTWSVITSQTYTGATALDEGTLELGTGGRLANTTALSLASGARLQLTGLGGTDSKLNTTAALGLNGGTIDLGGLTTSLDQQVGPLSLGAASIIDFGNLAAGATWRFANSSSSLWASGSTLNIWNWTAGADHLFFGTDGTGLTPSQLSSIRFFTDAGNTELGPIGFGGFPGDVAPVPEASTWLFGALLTGLGGISRRRKITAR